MKTESIEYQDGDVTLRGFLAYDDTKSGRRPGILVMPGGFGLGVNAKQRAEMLAGLGYVALAGDPYGNGLEIDDLQEVVKRVSALRADPAKFRQRAQVALDTLASLPQVDPRRLAAIGYCLGGTFVLELARTGAPLTGVVTFHGGLETPRPAAPGQVKAKILVCTGADDPSVPVAHVNAFANEMTKAGVDWQIISYGGTVHGFTYPDAPSRGIPWIAYNQLADERSWQAMRSFFEEIF
ncbi:MAG TPA: dienelactone hydrolase family protein [Candidatus Binatia bacterium]|nr:dienelactone hydrolase family protein [Candidatus Binatia bacterium]